MVTTANPPPPAPKYPLMTVREMSDQYNCTMSKITSYLWYHDVKPHGTRFNGRIGKDENTYLLTPELEKAIRHEPPQVDWLRGANREVKALVMDERRGKSLIGKRVTIQEGRRVFSAMLVAYNMCWFIIRINGKDDKYKHNEAKVLEEAK